MSANTGLDDAASSPVVLWVTIAAAAFAVVCGVLARALPPVVEAFGQITQARRQARQRLEDARILDLSNQVAHLSGRVRQLEQSSELQQAALIAHAAWDQQLVTAAIAAGLDVPPPPPLWAPPPPEIS